MKRRVAKFASEAAMCAQFIAIATGAVARPGWERQGPKPTGWIAYPETAGWDILLVRERDGFQIGIQAKLRLNDDVILQALESRHMACLPGPDCRAVLVPEGTGSALHHLFCQRAGIQVVTLDEDGRVRPEVPRQDIDEWDRWTSDWPQMLPVSREALPPVVPDVAAGVKSPLQLTAWKVKALKLAVVLEKRGWLCRQDFKHLEIDHRRFLDNQWLVAIDGAWRSGPHWPDFKRQHPRNFDEIAALYDDWKPAEPAGEFGRLM
ncbi:MAG: hypothetical protein J0I54_20590 [Bosea sp.]|uniref:hypothetical protein n=1 Tax=unclassified Bosea (in: a-proteobacteria) TaxID=2653178 RepID=UPI000967AD4F|nr:MULTISPECIES: hypothetical protein [unclassified Bosea (in: a-proteobacteria)]MBN9459038.1 hypothetical protein [Bosea sp. (in: a-proteobacteria)]OJV06220.1 MAG: hypothetical protein BGO20_08160 [Bosea sp. 67-29]